MKALTKEKLIKIIEQYEHDLIFDSMNSLQKIFDRYGDEYFVNRDTGELELCKKNESFKED